MRIRAEIDLFAFVEWRHRCKSNKVGSYVKRATIRPHDPIYIRCGDKQQRDA